MSQIKINPNEITVGVVGLGMMRCSIATCLLIAGHKVVAVVPVPDDLTQAGFEISGRCGKEKNGSK